MFDKLIKQELRTQAEDLFQGFIKENESKLLKLERRWLSRAEVSMYLNIAERTVDLYANREYFDKVFFGKTVRFDKHQIDSHLAAQISQIA